jgi:hypothetical protein
MNNLVNGSILLVLGLLMQFFPDLSMGVAVGGLGLIIIWMKERREVKT